MPKVKCDFDKFNKKNVIFCHFSIKKNLKHQTKNNENYNLKICVINFKIEQKRLTRKGIICPDAEKGLGLSFRLCNVKEKHSETECKNTACIFFSIFTLSSLE